MDVVITDVPAHVIAERQRLGLDIRDEVRDGDYHMVPSPLDEHQRMSGELYVLLHPLAKRAHLEIRFEQNLIPPDEPGWRDFRVPDLLVFPAAVRQPRGAVGAASLVVEIRSPGDESYEKLPFFERLGVGEVLIIERDTKAIRRWVLDGTVLVDAAADDAGRHPLRCLPVSLWTAGGRLVVDADGTVTTI